MTAEKEQAVRDRGEKGKLSEFLGLIGDNAVKLAGEVAVLNARIEELQKELAVKSATVTPPAEAVTDQGSERA